MLLEKRHLSPCSTHGCHTPRFVNSMLSAKLNKTGQGRRAAEDELIREHDQSKNLNLSKLQETADFPGGASGKESTCNAGVMGGMGLIPGLGRPPVGGHDNPLQYSCLDNPMDRGAWLRSLAEEPGWLPAMGSQRVNTTERLN